MKMARARSESRLQRIPEENLLQCLVVRGIVVCMARREAKPHFMNGVPELLILRLLARGEMYGYELVQAIRAGTGEVIAVGEGVVYPVLHGLEAEGALTSRRKTVGGRSRIYYTVTDAGTRRLADLAAAWTRLAGAVQTVLASGMEGRLAGGVQVLAGGVQTA